jgi:predicted CXXCH cytochrome family protein
MNKPPSNLLWTVLVLAICFMPMIARAQGTGSSVVNSPHNLSATGPGTIRATGEQQVCIFCHTPHNASPIQPLWNRNVPVAAYIPYSSSSLQAQPGQPTGTSKLCLSCHDGTIALGSVLSRNQPIAMAGGMTTLPPGHKANLGTDLSDDHPISFKYDAALATKDPKLRHPTALPAPTRLDAQQELQCTTCHDAHNNQFGKFLVMDNANSQLCRSCHNQEHTEVAAHVNCSSCHQPHTAPSGAFLLRGATVRDACARCHSGQVASSGTEQGQNVLADFLKMSNHDRPGPIDPTKVVKSQSNCNDCHGSHTMGVGSASAPNIPPNLGAVAGITLAGALVPRAQFEYEVCFKCHSGATGGTSTLRPPSVTRQVTQADVRLQFAPSAVSFHPVAAPGKNTDVPSLIPTLTATSMIYCADCHASDTASVPGTGVKGPHGSNVSPLLSGEYARMDNVAESPATYALCYKCHERTSILANESFTGHARHVVDHKTNCSVCHDAHGIASAQANPANHAHLINFDTSVVQRDRVTQRLEYITTGPRAGSCYLTCRNVDHSPKSYPADTAGAGGVAPLLAPNKVISPTPSILRNR